MPLAKPEAIHFPMALGLLLTALALAGCGGGGGSGGGGGDDRPDPVLPALAILSVSSIGQGDEIEVQVQLTAATNGPAPSIVFLASSIESPAAPGTTFRNDVTTATTGNPTGNGVLNIVPPVTGTLVVVLRISSRTPDLLPVSSGNELTIFLSDTVLVTSTTALFDITPQAGLLNEPTCSVSAPLGGTLSGDIPVQITVVDFENDPVDGTLAFSVDGGLTFAPCTLSPGSSPFLGAYAPTNPANTFVGPANQFVDATTPSVDLVWLSDLDLPPSLARQRVTLAVSVEDGTTAGVGPFSTCQSRFFVDNSPLDAPPATPVQITSHGDPAVVDPLGILGSGELPLGATGDLRLSGTGFAPGDVFSLGSTTAVALSAVEVFSSLLAVGSVRATPDGPQGVLDDTAQSSALGSVLVMRNGTFYSSFNLVYDVPLLSLSTDDFTVAPGGTFHLALQIPGAVGGDLSVAYSAVIHFDDGALDLVAASGGSSADWSGPPQTMFRSPPSGIALLTVFQDPVASRADLTGPVASVASLEMRVSAGVVPGTIVHLWMEVDDLDNLVLTQGGSLLTVGAGLGLLGTSILVQ